MTETRRAVRESLDRSMKDELVYRKRRAIIVVHPDIYVASDRHFEHRHTDPADVFDRKRKQAGQEKAEGNEGWLNPQQQIYEH